MGLSNYNNPMTMVFIGSLHLFEKWLSEEDLKCEAIKVTKALAKWRKILDENNYYYSR